MNLVLGINYYFGFFILCSIIKIGDCLECFSCNVSSSEFDDNACKGIGSLKKCPGSSVCLSSSYQVTSGTVKTYTSMRGCFPNMADQECKHFLKSQRDMMYDTAVITPITCYTCNQDNCNKNMYSQGNNRRSTVLLICVLSAIITLGIFN